MHKIFSAESGREGFIYYYSVLYQESQSDALRNNDRCLRLARAEIPIGSA